MRLQYFPGEQGKKSMNQPGEWTAVAQPRNGKRWVFWFGGLIVAMIIAAAAWFLIPQIVASQLAASFGKRPYALALREAETANQAALSNLQPLILVDVPGRDFIPVIQDLIGKAAADAKLPDATTFVLQSSPFVSFLDYVIRIEAPIQVTHPKWGSTDLRIQVDAVPSVRGDELVITPSITKVEIGRVSPFGFTLPSAATPIIERIVTQSLDALNSKLNVAPIPIKLPEQMAKVVNALPALLVTDKGITVLLGPRRPARDEVVGSYKERFLIASRLILPSFEPGQGVLGVGSMGGPAGASLRDVSDALVARATAQNLRAAEALLNITSRADPMTLGAEAFTSTLLVSVSPEFFSKRLHSALVNIITKIQPKGMKINIRPEDIAVRMLDGAAEAEVSGSATFADGALRVDFALTAWATLYPEPGGIVAEYAPRRIELRQVFITWDGRETALKVPYQDQLGELLAKIVGELPRTPIAIPSLPLKFNVPEQKAFKIVLNDTMQGLRLQGRAIVLSPLRVQILAAAALVNAPEAGLPQANPGDGQFQRLEAIVARGEYLLSGGKINDTAAIVVGKPGFATLMGKTWTTLDPRIVADYKDDAKFDAGEIKLIPPNASCGNACQHAESCGDVASCTINVCRDVLVKGPCVWSCPGGPFNPLCSNVCGQISKQVCGPESDSSCTNRISACTSGAAECLARWTSGLQATCEATLRTINATGFNGLAKVSGGIAIAAAGETFRNSALRVAPNLGAIGLEVKVVAHATVDAHLDITFTDFGNLFLCPSGRLSAKPEFHANLEDKQLSAQIKWTGGGNQPLKANLAFNDATIHVATAEPPLVTLVKENPGLLLCGPATAVLQPIVGLSIISSPKITRELLAGVLRTSIPRDKAAIAAAIIDGQYDYKASLPSVEFEIPSAIVNILNTSLRLNPRLAENAIVIGVSEP
jgi:hypothetical protein